MKTTSTTISNSADNGNDCSINGTCHFACPHCFSRLNEPRTLFCGHTFCYVCLQELVIHKAMTCPVCFTGVLGRLDRFLTNRLLQKILNIIPKEASSPNSSMLDSCDDPLSVRIENIKNCLQACQSEEALTKATLLRIRYPNQHLSYYWYGICLNEMGRKVEALDVLFHAMQLNPFDKNVENALTKLLEENPRELSNYSQYMSMDDLTTSCSKLLNPHEMNISALEEDADCHPHVDNNTSQIQTTADNNYPTTTLTTPAPSTRSLCVCLHTNFIPVEDFECNLCYRLLLRPTSTPCGHTFCRSCLQRALDHRLTCPMCNYNLTEYYNHGPLVICALIEKIMLQLWPNEYHEREIEMINDFRQYFEDEHGEVTCVPVMVCTLALPEVPCPLHIFEPRYRAMLRLTIEAGTKKFGMAMPIFIEDPITHVKTTTFADVITVLKIKHFEYSVDGRCILDTVGEQRYRVLSRFTKDGYDVARVVPFKDDTLVNKDEKTLKLFCQRVHDLALNWFRHQQITKQSMIISHYGPLPEAQSNKLGNCVNGPPWHWWITSVLPLTQEMKYKLLCTQSVATRLSTLAKCILRITFAERRRISETASNSSSGASP